MADFDSLLKQYDEADRDSHQQPNKRFTRIRPSAERINLWDIFSLFDKTDKLTIND